MPNGPNGVKPSVNTAKKTAKSPRNGAEIPLGAHPGNTGGKKGRSGRKPDWLKEFCDDLLADPKAMEQVREILQNKDHAAFSAMWKAVADRAYGRPTQAVDLNASDTLADLIVAARGSR